MYNFLRIKTADINKKKEIVWITNLNVRINGNGMRYRCKCAENDVTCWMISNLMR